eukprot:131944-Pelagomonas_calceolata.AAC.1
MELRLMSAWRTFLRRRLLHFLGSAQDNGMESHKFCTNKFAKVCMLPLCRLQLLSGQASCLHST